MENLTLALFGFFFGRKERLAAALACPFNISLAQGPGQAVGSFLLPGYDGNAGTVY